MKKMRVGKFIYGVLIAATLLAVLNNPVVQALSQEADYDCSQQSSVPEDQCDALVAIYNSTGGEDWNTNTGWVESTDPCQWYGVACSEGAVVALDLYGNNLTGSLPIEIGGFPNLKTLTINGNPLSGPIPLTITFIDLDLFHFHDTSLCEPADPTFQDWLSQIVYRLSSGLYCSTLAPTSTSAPIPTQEDLPWPQQTLTALAAESTGITGALSAVTPEPTATKYYSLESPTPTASGGEQSSGDDDTGVISEPAEASQPGSDLFDFLESIPRGWLLVLMVPLVLIVIGILLELRDQRKEKNREKVKLDYSDIEPRQ